MRYSHKVFFLLPGLTLAGGLLASPAHADGKAIARELNEQWKKNSERCTDSSGNIVSALACSGVLIKPLPDNGAEKKMASAGALFLRQDLKFPDNITGMILPEKISLGPDEKSMSAACVRPVSVGNDTVREAFGCGKNEDKPHNYEDSDVSTCNQQAIGPDMPGWIWDGECSLSVLIHQEFSRAMALNKSDSANPDKKAMQVWFRHWPAAFGMVAPQALIYTIGDNAALKARQIDKSRLKSKNPGVSIPIIGFSPKQTTGPFVYESGKDIPLNLSPQDVVDNLNNRFNSEVSSCDNGKKAALYCSGIIMHAAGTGSYMPWDYPARRNDAGISFFYYRKDAAAKGFGISWSGPNGIIFKSQEAQITDGQSVSIDCIYPVDADTNSGIDGVAVYNRAASLCQPNFSRSDVREVLGGRYFNYPMEWSNDRSSCRYDKELIQQLPGHNISKADENSLLEAWDKTNGKGRDIHGYCSFSTQNAAEFITGVRATTRHKAGSWNELMIRPYPKSTAEDVGRLPIEAFFYVHGASTESAKKWRQNYADMMHIDVNQAPPIVKVDFSRKESPFSL